MDLSAALHKYLDASAPEWGASEVSTPEEIGRGWESTIHAFTLDGPGRPAGDIVLRRYTGPYGGAKADREFHVGIGIPALPGADQPRHTRG